jgi:hypothetical protein
VLKVSSVPHNFPSDFLIGKIRAGLYGMRVEGLERASQLGVGNFTEEINAISGKVILVPVECLK